MALTNIFREPRREITETAVGLAVVAAFLWGDSFLALWIHRCGGTFPNGEAEIPMLLAYIIGLCLILACVALLILIHTLGEGICNWLSNHGLELRPRNRH